MARLAAAAGEAPVWRVARERADPLRWAPLVVPLFALLLTVLVFFIASEVLERAA